MGGTMNELDNREFAKTCLIAGLAIIPSFALFVAAFFINTMVSL